MYAFFLQVSEQRQKNTELEAAVHTLTSDLDKVSTQLSSISTILSDLDDLKRKVAQLQIDLGKQTCLLCIHVIVRFFESTAFDELLAAVVYLHCCPGCLTLR